MFLKLSRDATKAIDIPKFSKFAFVWFQEIPIPPQRSALRKITRSPKVPNYEIQGAQRKAYMKEIRLSGRPKKTVGRLRHPGTLRAQPCSPKDGSLVWALPPLKIWDFETSLPFGISNDHPWVGYGYFLDPHILHLHI